jgi:alanine dehydrogenase
VKVISRAEAEELLPMGTAIGLVRGVFAQTSTPEIVQPLRTVVRVPGKPSVLGSMPAHVGSPQDGCFGVKTVVVSPGNSAYGLDTHLGVVTVFDRATGAPRAVIEAGSVTAIRTAAASAVATRVLARDGACDVAVIGSGRQARLHLLALHESMQVRTAAIWGRNQEAARALADWAGETFPFAVTVAPTVRAAARQASIICTVTSSAEALLGRDDVVPGTHVNAVGACFPSCRELGADLVAAARIVVDNAEAARAEAGDLLLAAAELGTPPGDLPELGAVLRGQARGRCGPDEITVFESLGFAALDVAAASWISAEADRLGKGVSVPLDP